MERTGVKKGNDKVYYMKKSNINKKLWQNTSNNSSDFFKSWFLIF